MATNVGTLSTQVADRVRDPNFEGTSENNIASLISYAQQVINGAVEDVAGTATLALVPGRLVYQLSTTVGLESAIRIQAVRDASGRDLEPLGPFESLAWVNMRWLNSVSDTPRAFAMAGRDLLIIYPGVRTTQNVTVIYSEYLAPVTTTQSTSVQDETDAAIMDLAELLLLLKNRDMSGAPQALKRFSDRVQQIRSESR